MWRLQMLPIYAFEKFLFWWMDPVSQIKRYKSWLRVKLFFRRGKYKYCCERSLCAFVVSSSSRRTFEAVKDSHEATHKSSNVTDEEIIKALRGLK